MQDRWINRAEMPSKWILVVEDVINRQTMLSNFLSTRYRSEGEMLVCLAPTARHAAAMLEDPVLIQRLHCILLDHDLPWGWGPELMDLLKAKQIKAPVCAISGLDGNNQRLVAMGAQTSANKLDLNSINQFLQRVDQGTFKH